MNIRRWLLIPVAYCTITLLGFYLAMFQSTILNYTQFHNVDSVAMGATISANYIGVSLVPLSIGLLTIRYGKKCIVLLSYIMVVLGTFSIFLFSDIALHIAAFFLIGGGYGVAEATLSAVLIDEFHEKSTMHMNFSQMFFSVGALIGPFISKMLINNGLDFRYLYLYMSVAFLALCVCFAFTRQSRDIRSKGESTGGTVIIGIVKQRAFIFLTLALILYVGIEELVGFFADSYFYNVARMPQYSAAALSLYWGFMIPSRFLAGVVKVGIKTKILFCSVLLAFASVTAMLCPLVVVKLVCFALIGFGTGPLWPLLMSSAGDRYPDNTGPVFNILMSLGGVGGVVLPFVAGIFVSVTNESFAYYLSALCAVMLFIFYIVSAKQKANNPL